MFNIWLIALLFVGSLTLGLVCFATIVIFITEMCKGESLSYATLIIAPLKINVCIWLASIIFAITITTEFNKILIDKRDANKCTYNMMVKNYDSSNELCGCIS